MSYSDIPLYNTPFHSPQVFLIVDYQLPDSKNVQTIIWNQDEALEARQDGSEAYTELNLDCQFDIYSKSKAPSSACVRATPDHDDCTAEDHQTLREQEPRFYHFNQAAGFVQLPKEERFYKPTCQTIRLYFKKSLIPETEGSVLSVGNYHTSDHFDPTTLGINLELKKDGSMWLDGERLPVGSSRYTHLVFLGNSIEAGDEIYADERGIWLRVVPRSSIPSL